MQQVYVVHELKMNSLTVDKENQVTILLKTFDVSN